jgi:hypothetical protein
MRRYYYAGATRVAMREEGTLYYLLGDHLGSTAVTASSAGAKVAGYATDAAVLTLVVSRPSLFLPNYSSQAKEGMNLTSWDEYHLRNVSV